jgi:hypothetical protein
MVSSAVRGGTGICLRLMEGADIYQIAKNCRTSVEMIEKYCAVHIRTALDIAAINVRRERPRKVKSGPRQEPESSSED